jgi:hypothetical protein
MSKEEVYIAQGKARDELKEVKSYVATLTASVRSHATLMKDLGTTLENLPTNESGKDAQLRVESIKSQLRKLSPDAIAGEVDELVFRSQMLRSLQEQVDNF